MKTFSFFLFLFLSVNGHSQPTPQTAAECAQEMIGRQLGNATPAGGCALTLATQLRALSRLPNDGSRTQAALINQISEGFTSCYPAVPGANAAAGRFISTVGEINDVNSTTFGGSSCLGDMWADIDARMAGTANPARNVGDPHISTLDGLNYNFQAEGIFTNLVNDKNDFIVESIYKKISKRAIATYAVAFAFKLGKNVINISFEAPFLFVNGVPQSFLSTVVLDDGVTISKKLNRFEIKTMGNDQISVVLHKTFLDMHIKLSPLRIGSIKGGLLGDFDLNKKNDLTSKDGITIDIETRKKNPKIYTVLGDSYRVERKDSLFCEPILGLYPDFDRAFPLNLNQPVTTEAQLAQAKKTCENKAITQEPFLENCIHDVIASGNNTFVESAVVAQKIKTNPELFFRQNNLGLGFSGSYELEFKVIKKNGEMTTGNINLSTRTDDSAIEYRVDGAVTNRVVTDYLTNKMTTIRPINGRQTGFRKHAEQLLSWEMESTIQWSKTDVTKKILGYDAILYNFSISNVKGQAWIAKTLKHNHIFPFKYFIGLLRDEAFPSLLFQNYLFGYNYYGMILEAQIDDKNGSRILKVKNISNSPNLKMLDLSSVVIKDL